MTDEKNRRSLSSVRSSGAQVRLEAIEAQLAAGLNLCATAENAVVLRRVQDGRKAIERARHTAQSIHAHVNEHSHLPADSIALILDRLAELERQISKLDEQLSS